MDYRLSKFPPDVKTVGNAIIYGLSSIKNQKSLMDKSLNKYISETGICSRREADRFIEEGKVMLNGVVARKGNRVGEGDLVLLNNRPLIAKPEIVYLAFNKPRGITCTTDLKDNSNIIDFLKYPQRIFPIGRLDKPSDGLIFLTNDGDIVNKILRAGNNHEKEYVVTVDLPIDNNFIKKMGSGIRILDTITQPCIVKQEGTHQFRIILKQGLNRQIRRMCESLGYQVRTLTRVRIMNITLKGIPIGKYRAFTKEEVDTINQLVANSSKTSEASFFDE
jgi:23S rRNA pseudouridine2604 synthase